MSLLLATVFKSEYLRPYSCPGHTRLFFPGEDEWLGPVGAMSGGRLEVPACGRRRNSWDANVWRKLDIFPESVQFTGDDIQLLSPRKWNTFPWQPQGCVITQLQNVDSWKKASSDITPRPPQRVFFRLNKCTLLFNLKQSGERHIFNSRYFMEINL